MKDTKVLQFVDTSLLNKDLNDSIKAEIALLLDKSGIDILEIPTQEAPFTNSVVTEVQNAVVAISCIPSQEEIDEAWELVEDAIKPGLRLKLNAETYKKIDLEKKQDKEDLLKLIKDSASYCKQKTEHVELVIELSENLHQIFIYKIIETAAEAGLKKITISDTQAHLLPHEFDELFADIVYNLPEFDTLILGVSSTNKLGLATANSIAAIRNGARQVDVRPIVTPSCEDNATLKHILNILRINKKDLKLKTNLEIDTLKEVNSKVKEGLTH